MTGWFLPGYIDPGSGMQFFSFLGPILAALLAVVGFLIWPFRMFWGFFNVNRSRRILGGVFIFLILGAGVLWLIKGQSIMSSSGNFPRVLVIGVDGMDPQITRQLMTEGKLPNFERLAQEGSFTTIETTNPAQSPVAWSTITTGANPGEHGLFDFIWRHEEDYLPELSLAVLEKPDKSIKLFGQEIPLGRPQFRSQRGGLPVWELTSKAKVPTVVIRWPVTFPPEQVHGSMLAGMGVPDIRGGQGTFSFFTSAKIDNTRPQGGIVVPVAGEGKIQTRLSGPRGANGQELTIPFEIEPDPDTHSAQIHIEGNSFRLQQGAWSKWIRVKFSVDIFTGIKGMCRFYLKSATHPFELYVSPINFDPRAPVFPISYTPDYSRRLQEAVGDFHTLGMPHDTWALNEGRMDEEMFLSQTDTIVAEETAMVSYELKRFKGGLFMAVFETLDRIQHMFWRYRDAKSPLYNKEEAKKYGHVIDRYYEGMDRILGQILEQIDSQTILLVVSDHGFTDFRRTVHLNRWLADQDYQTLKGGVKEGRPLFRDVDWSQTQAYAAGLGSLYLNLKGRESQGKVMPGEEKRKIEDEIIEKLVLLKDPQNGDSVVQKVYRRDEIFSGSRLEKMPDLVVAFRPGYRASWQTALGATPEAVIEDNLKKWSGDHIVDPSFVPGVLFSNRKINSDQTISLYDIAPTVLSFFGISPPKGYLGRPIFNQEKELLVR